MGVDRPVRPRLGQSMRERRSDLGWTQARLAAAMAVGPGDVARWERGDSLPPASTIRVAVRVLGASPEVARNWLEEAGGAHRGTTADSEIAARMVSGDGPADPFGGSGPKPRPRPTADNGPATPAAPPRSTLGIVFLGYAPAVVYSSGPLLVDATRFAIGRFARTSAVLIALGVVLWWAFGQLGTAF